MLTDKTNLRVYSDLVHKDYIISIKPSLIIENTFDVLDVKNFSYCYSISKSCFEFLDLQDVIGIASKYTDKGRESYLYAKSNKQVLEILSKNIEQHSKHVKEGKYDGYAIRDNLSKNKLKCYNGLDFVENANEWAYYVTDEAATIIANKLCEVGYACSTIITDMDMIK